MFSFRLEIHLNCLIFYLFWIGNQPFFLTFRLELLTECESHPDQWFRGKVRDKYNSNLKAVAEFVGKLHYIGHIYF